MDAKRDPADARADGAAAPLELRIGQETVTIWLDDDGIHFEHPVGRRTQGLLPWDVALAMSLIPSTRRPRADSRAA